MTITIREIEIQLLTEKAIFLPQMKMLVIADMHLGKLVHFRRKGIFVPTAEVNADLMVLELLINRLQPAEVLFLGDLFHSEFNSDYRNFMEVISRFSNVKFMLTKGNHDIIPKTVFNDTQIEIINERLIGNDIVLRHQLPKIIAENAFYIIGHVHPGYVIQGRGRQAYRLPCFHQTESVLTLPAFGEHTGLFIPDISVADKCYVIMNDEVILVRN